MRQQDQDWMDTVRVPSTTTDREIQQKLNELYSKQDLQEQKKNAMQHVLSKHVAEQYTVLAISESAVSIDFQMRR